MHMTHPDNEEEESTNAEREPESAELQADETGEPRMGTQSGSNPNIVNKKL